MKAIVFFIFLMLNFQLYAESFLGQWKIDKAKTIEFNKSKAVVSELWHSLLSCLADNSILMIKQDSYELIEDAHICSYDGKASLIDGFIISSTYKIVFQNKQKTALLIEDTNSLEMIYFVDENLFWSYYPGEFNDYDSHVRIYYRRASK